MQLDPVFDGPGTFLKGNLHTHSTLSDGERSPDAVCDAYAAAGYDFLALTDHFLERYGFPVSDTRRFRRKGFTTLLGAEVHAPQTSHGEAWHLLAVGLPLGFDRTAPDETAPRLAERCLAAGAFLAIAHPGWYGLTMADAASIPGAHAIEIYNHTSHVRTDRGDGRYLADALLGARRRIGLIAVDDAHFACADAFGGWVMVRTTANEPDIILDALKAGHYYASQGPRIEAVLWGDDAVEVRCSAAAAVMVVGHASRAAQVLGEGLTRAILPLRRLRPGGFARIIVADAAGRRAWSQARFF
jgi:histidinol phosphatase-like PHP family hydrolase